MPPLQVLADGPHEVVAVLTQPDRPSGRGKKIVFGPVKQAALDAGLDVLQPQTLKDPDVQQQLRDLNADLMVVVAYGLLLPPEVLNIPRLGCINLHASLLPPWRGASPMQMAILHGDEDTGISIMQMDEGLDTGPVYSKRSIPIGPHETVEVLHDRLAQLGAQMLRGAVGALLAGELECGRQSGEGVTYAPRIKKADGLIDWSKSAAEIDRQVRAYAGWPVAHTLYKGEPLRVHAAEVGAAEASVALTPGSVIGSDGHGIRVQTGDGILMLTSLQLAGRKRVTAADFANAHDATGLVLGL